MNRRDFLRMLGMAAPVAAAPKYFLPPIGGWRSDWIVNPYPEAFVSAIELEDVLDSSAYDNFFISTPLQTHLRELGVRSPFNV